MFILEQCLTGSILHDQSDMDW